MNKAIILIAFLFAGQSAQADSVTMDLDRLLERLDTRTAQELENYEGDRGVAKIVGKVSKKKKKHASKNKARVAKVSKKKLKRNLAHSKSKKKKHS